MWHVGRCATVVLTDKMRCCCTERAAEANSCQKGAEAACSKRCLCGLWSGLGSACGH